MGLLKTFYPSEIQDSTYVIPFEDWKQKGYEGVIFDIDNTLVPHGVAADERSMALFQKLKGVYKKFKNEKNPHFNPCLFPTTVMLQNSQNCQKNTLTNKIHYDRIM